MSAGLSGTEQEKDELISTWIRERRIFCISNEGQEFFPNFQFRDSVPIPVISEVIGIFPTSTTSWDMAFFFASPNGYIGGAEPFRLAESDPQQLKSLAERFVHASDVF